MASTATLIGLPTEIRLGVWQYVLQCRVPIIPGRFPDKPICHLPQVDVGLLCVCKQILAEALPVLYGANTLRIERYTDLRRGGNWTLHVHRLELIDSYSDEFIAPLHLVRTLNIAQSFPKLERLTISWDALFESHPRIDHRIRGIHDLLRSAGISGARFIGVGELELPGPRATVILKHYGIAQAWEKVKSVGEIDLIGRIRQKRRPYDYVVSMWKFGGVNIPDLFAMLDLYLSLAVPGWAARPLDLTSLQKRAITRYFEGIPSELLCACLPAGLPVGTPIRAVGLAEHGEEAVEWVTVLLEEVEKQEPGSTYWWAWGEPSDREVQGGNAIAT